MTDQELGHGSYATVLELEYMELKCAGKKIHELLLRQGDASYIVRRFEEECRLLSDTLVRFLNPPTMHYAEVLATAKFKICQMTGSPNLKDHVFL